MTSVELAAVAALAHPVSHNSAPALNVAPITSSQLMAKMVEISSPVAHGAFKISCVNPVGRAAQAIPWQNRIEISPKYCRGIGQIILHRPTKLLTFGLPVLLHEAAHMAQWREDHNIFLDPTHAYEHDAECRMLHAFPKALRTLRYGSNTIRAAVKEQRETVLAEDAPYGGECPG